MPAPAPAATRHRHPPPARPGRPRRPQPTREPRFPEPWMRALWRTLAKRWPRLFDPGRPAPLAVGIDRELATLLRPALSRCRIRRFLAIWTGRTPYLRALAAPGALRRGLDGRTAPVAPEHREHARRRLAERLRRRNPSRLNRKESKR